MQFGMFIATHLVRFHLGLQRFDFVVFLECPKCFEMIALMIRTRLQDQKHGRLVRTTNTGPLCLATASETYELKSSGV